MKRFFRVIPRRKKMYLVTGEIQRMGSNEKYQVGQTVDAYSAEEAEAEIYLYELEGYCVNRIHTELLEEKRNGKVS